MKTATMRQKPSNVPQTLELDQAYVVPPHCSARSKQTMAEIKKTAPRMSICLIRSFLLIWEYRRAGLVKKKNTTARETPPKGKLIQKHQRQLRDD